MSFYGDSESDTSLCIYCNGSGEGKYDGQICIICKGNGVIDEDKEEL
jgi:DnaJ-class molecular chaperone